MNKLELTAALKNDAELTKSEAAAVVDLFLMRWPMRLQRVTELKSADCVHFLLMNIKRMPGEIPKLGKESRWLLKKLPFFKCGNELKDRMDY